MKILSLLLALAAPLHAATFYLPTNDAGVTGHAKVSGVNSSLFAINSSGNVVMLSDGTYAPASHGHAIGDVTNLQTTLNAKAPLASPAFTGAGTIEGASNPVWDIRRTTAATNSVAATSTLTAISSGDAADGFGPILGFRISDTGVSNNLIGSAGFVRAGSDGTGDFVVRNQVSGSATEMLRVSAGGDILLNGTSSTGSGGIVRATSPVLTTPAIANQGTGAFGMVLTHNGTLTADRTLTVDIGNADRTLTISNNVSLNQSLTTTSQPTFARVQATASSGSQITDTGSFRNSSGGTGAGASVNVYNNIGNTVGTHGVSIYLTGGGNTGAEGPNAAGVINRQNGPLSLGTNNTTRMALGASGGVAFTDYLDLTEQASEPAAPSANGARLFLVDDGSGKTVLKVKFATGSAQQISIQP